MDGDQQEFGDGGGCEPTGRSWWIQPGGESEQLVQLKTFLQTCNCAKSKNGFGKDNILVGGYWWWEEQKVDQIASTASDASKVRNSILFQILTPDSSKSGKINHFESKPCLTFSLTKLRLQTVTTQLMFLTKLHPLQSNRLKPATISTQDK